MFETVEYGADIPQPDIEPAEYNEYGNKFSGWNNVPEKMPDHDVDITGSYEDSEPPVITKITINGIVAYDPETIESVECINSATVAIDAVDKPDTDNSGIDKITYIINGGEAQVYENPFSIEPGTYTISVTATDKAGNPSEPVVVTAVVRQEASFPQDASYTYTQLSKKDVVLEGLDIHGAIIAKITIDGKDVELPCVQDGNKVTLKSEDLDNVKVGEHTLCIFTKLNNTDHDTGIECKLMVEGFDVEVKSDDNTKDGYCNDEDAVITLEFLNELESLPNSCKIEGIKDGVKSLFGVYDLAALSDGTDSKRKVNLNLSINSDIMKNELRDADGNMKFEVTFYYKGKPNTESKVQPISIKINGSSDLIIELFEDILAIDNHDDLYTAFQWYKNGVEIERATLQYYQSQQLKGRYGAYVTTTDGKTLNICPIEVGESVSKSLKHSVNVYPNPANAYEEVTIELLNFADVEYEGCVIRIVNALGATAATINNCDRINTVSLPSGTYTGYVIRNGKDDKVSFKLIVK